MARDGQENIRLSGGQEKVNGAGNDCPQGNGYSECAEYGTHPECIGYSEIDKYASAIYRFHYPEHKAFGDANEINPRQLPDFDLLVGGFPCQAFSIAGKRQGFEDTRGTLFFEIARLLTAKRPRYFLLENVKGLLSHDEGKTFQTILGVLSDIGYEYQWQVLNSKDFGVPQNRERVFIVGYIRGECRPEIFPIGETNEIYSKSDKQIVHAIDSNYHKGWLDNQQRTMVRETKDGFHMRRNDKKQSSIQGTHVTYPEGKSHCLNAHVPMTIEQTSIRRLTPMECERLQGFPDDWTMFGVDVDDNLIEISDTQRYKCCGNAVTTNVVTAVIEQLKGV